VSAQPLFSVNEGMTPGLSFAEDLAVLAEAGVDGIGIAAGQVGYGRFKLQDDRADLERFRASGLKGGFCNPGTPSILPRSTQVAGALGLGADDPAARIEGICRDIRRLAPFEPICCICVPGPVGAYDEAEAREIAVAGFKQVARAAREVGVKVAIEPMHSSIRNDFTFLTTLPGAVELIDEIDEPNVGVLYDVWHLWDTPDLVAHTREHASRIVGVHVDDRREPTRSWCDRVLPGDGVADLESILSALIAGGYDGWYELEVLSDDGTFGNDFPDSLWKRDPVELIRAGREQFMQLWDKCNAAANAAPPR
jgi:sugar phosphate isomerase/epimerase